MNRLRNFLLSLYFATRLLDKTPIDLEDVIDNFNHVVSFHEIFDSIILLFIILLNDLSRFS